MAWVVAWVGGWRDAAWRVPHLHGFERERVQHPLLAAQLGQLRLRPLRPRRLRRRSVHGGARAVGPRRRFRRAASRGLQLTPRRLGLLPLRLDFG